MSDAESADTLDPTGLSLQAQYEWEREGIRSIEKRWGFIRFKFEEDYCYISSVFILPQYRMQEAASVLAEEVEEAAKARGIKRLLGSVDPDLKGAHESQLVMLKRGFKLSHIHGRLIIYEKGI